MKAKLAADNSKAKLYVFILQIDTEDVDKYIGYLFLIKQDINRC